MNIYLITIQLPAYTRAVLIVQSESEESAIISARRYYIAKKDKEGRLDKYLSRYIMRDENYDSTELDMKLAINDIGEDDY